MHKQKLYSLIIAGIAFISLLLPWVTVNMGLLGGGSVNGFRNWGILSLLGVLGVLAACFLGNRESGFDENMKKIALASFAAIAIGALIFFLRLNSYSFMASSGFGLWLCLITGIAGILWNLGIIKIPDQK